MFQKYLFKVGIPLILMVGLWILGCGAAQASSMEAVWPEAPGYDVRTDGSLVIDASNMDKGYVMVKGQPTNHGLKLRITSGQWQLNYDLNSQGEYEAFPLQLGSRVYEVALFENVKGNKYASEGKVSLDAHLNNEYAAFMVPNQYVSYELWTSAVQKSDEICAGRSPSECFNAINAFMSSEFAYDFVRAKTIPAGSLPDIDYCYDNRMGICQDLAAVTACMLRVQGIPTKLVIGYADQYYHAWTTVVVNGQEMFYDPTHAVGAINASRYSVEREY